MYCCLVCAVLLLLWFCDGFGVVCCVGLCCCGVVLMCVGCHRFVLLRVVVVVRDFVLVVCCGAL